jgi:ABC-type Mn2+/Zn2+ transport system permease subunit
MALAIAACGLFTVAGLAASYRTDLPAGPVIIVIAAAAYLAVAVGKRLVAGRR